MNTDSMTPVTSTKPYLLRAIFEWAEDNGFTPQVLVNAVAEDVEVPQTHVVDGQIVLNISSTAVQLHVMDNDCLSFSARFNGIEHDLYLPMPAILAIFARENSQGIFFDEIRGDFEPDPDKKLKPTVSKPQPTSLESKRDANAKKTSHLKVIK